MFYGHPLNLASSFNCNIITLLQIFSVSGPVSRMSFIWQEVCIVVFTLSNLQTSNGLLVEQQAGFRKKHSTQTSLFRITNQWLLDMDKGSLCGVVFLDLKKAFDCVDHNILIRKMNYYGIRSRELAWFQSYLNNRTQICKMDQTTSNERTLKCGIPQGSNLGPLLFLLYINDLPNCLSSSTSMFADDTNILLLMAELIAELVHGRTYP